MSAPRYPLVIDGEPGPRYAFAFARMTLHPHDGELRSSRPGMHSRARAARCWSESWRYSRWSDDGGEDRREPVREFLNSKVVMPTCLEAS